MSIYKEILKKHWGYEDFRPLQEDIIRSVVENKKDTLGLLPTGGGKSIIFQVPGLLLDGVCIVISPLIALMKDQVENLKKREISAAAIYTGMSRKEILFSLDQASEGHIKFLYVSPERLGTSLFLERLKSIKVNLLAVDEAHCISQWGYDFRPSYLKIAQIRQYLPGVNILALTATATPKVVDDIQVKLNFPVQNVFRKSFERSNLIYIVKKVDNKYGNLLKLIQTIKGTGIVYVRSRKLTEKIAEFLRQNFIAADFYHAGLSPKEKDKKQEAWKNDITRVIVATNAFGMGIDKPDVRFVIHIDLTDSLEAYFQEAGRGGRDLIDSYSFLLYNDADIENLENSFNLSFPPKEKIFLIYEALCNDAQIPVGTGEGQNYDLIISNFANKYNFTPLEVYNSLKFMQREGYLEFTENIFIKSELHISIHRNDLYKFQVENQSYDPFIKFMLRNYPGLFSEYIQIDEYWIARSLQVEPAVIFKILQKMHQLSIVDYVPTRTTPYFTLLENRVHPKEFSISQENYDFLKQTYKEKIEAVINYVKTEDKCRSRLLLEYFGEFDSNDCGRCDICYNLTSHHALINEIAAKILKIIHTHQLTLNELVMKMEYDIELVREAVKLLLDGNRVLLTEQRKLQIKTK